MHLSGNRETSRSLTQKVSNTILQQDHTEVTTKQSYQKQSSLNTIYNEKSIPANKKCLRSSDTNSQIEHFVPCEDESL